MSGKNGDHITTNQLLYAKQFHCMKMTNDLVMLLQSVRGEKIT